MPKEHEFSIDFRKLVIEHYSDGNSIRTISRKVKLPHYSILYNQKVEPNWISDRSEWSRSKTSDYKLG